MQSNRISHFFDLRGPSFTMDTACSSSLVALHQACQSLRTRESQSAIVGGCHLNMLPEFFCSFSNSRSACGSNIPETCLTFTDCSQMKVDHSRLIAEALGMAVGKVAE